jgi:tRNA U34 5-carboxymethylaminomethyl modifying enzyme MnmG/GidA
MARDVWKFYREQKPRIDGTVLVLAGVVVLVWVGVRSASSKAPLSGMDLVVVLAAATVLQIAGGATFGHVGRVNPEKAKSAVRRLLTVGFSTRHLRTALQGSLHSTDVDELRATLIRMDEGLRFISWQITDSVADWNDVHSEALRDVIDSQRLEDTVIQGSGEAIDKH